MASCGLPARPLIARKPLARLAEYSINAPVSGEKGGGWHTQCAAVLQCQSCSVSVALPTAAGQPLKGASGCALPANKLHMSSRLWRMP